MTDLRNHKGVVLEELARLREDDKGRYGDSRPWGWRLKGISKSRILIRWGYLDYIGQKGDFAIELYDEDGDVNLIGNTDTEYSWADNDDADYLFCWIGEKHYHDAKTVDDGIRKLVRRLAEYAHTRY